MLSVWISTPSSPSPTPILLHPEGALHGEALLCSEYLADLAEAQEQAQRLRDSVEGAGGGLPSGNTVGDSFAYTSFADSSVDPVEGRSVRFRQGALGSGANSGFRGRFDAMGQAQVTSSQAYASFDTVPEEDNSNTVMDSVVYSSVAGAQGMWRAGRGPGIVGPVPLGRPITPSQLSSRSSFGIGMTASGRRDPAAQHGVGRGGQRRADGSTETGIKKTSSVAGGVGSHHMSPREMAEMAANKLRMRRIQAGDAPEPEAAGVELEGEFVGAFLARRELPRSPVPAARNRAKASASAAVASRAAAAGGSAASRAGPGAQTMRQAGPSTRGGVGAPKRAAGRQP